MSHWDYSSLPTLKNLKESNYHIFITLQIVYITGAITGGGGLNEYIKTFINSNNYVYSDIRATESNGGLYGWPLGPQQQH